MCDSVSVQACSFVCKLRLNYGSQCWSVQTGRERFTHVRLCVFVRLAEKPCEGWHCNCGTWTFHTG